MPGIPAKSLTKKTDHVQVQEMEGGGRAKSHWTVKVYKKTASFTRKQNAEEAAAALRMDLAARQPETASAEDRAVAPSPEAQGASAPDTTTGEPEAQAAAPDTSTVAPAALTHEDGDEIVQVGGGDGVQGVEGVESAEGVAGARDVAVKLDPEDNLRDIKMKVVPENSPVAQDSAAAQGSAMPADSAVTQDTQVLWQSVADQDAAEVRRCLARTKGYPLLRELQTASGPRLEVKHNAKRRSLYLGAMRRCSVVTVSGAMQANGSLTTRLNRFGRVLFPAFSWTAIGVCRFLEEGQPMLLHVHPRDDVPLSCEVSLGRHAGGELWTGGLLDGYGPVCGRHGCSGTGTSCMEAPSRRAMGLPSMHTGRNARCAGRASAAWWSSFRWWGGPTPAERLPASWRQPHSHANRYQMTADDPHE